MSDTTDIEEPPTKMSKYEMSQTYTQPEEEMEEDGQEEWLSEGILTDEDCNPASEHDRSDSAIGNVTQMSTSLDTSTKVDDSNIEQKLNSMDNKQQDDLPDDLDTFLIRKTDVSKQPAEDDEESDGNDTDDLLRMLEDDGKTKKKKKVKFSPKERQDTAEHSSGDDDDGFVYDTAVVKKLRVVKNVLMRKQPASKAEPEHSTEDSDDTSDEADTVKKMFGVRKSNNFAAKSTAKPHIDTPRPPRENTVTEIKKPGNSITHIVKRAPETRTVSWTPIKQYSNKVLQSKPIRSLRSSTPKQKSAQPVKQPVGQPVKQPIAQTVKQPVVQLAKQPVVQLSKQPVVQLAKQPVFQPLKQPGGQPVRHPIDQLVKQPVDQQNKQPTRVVKKVVVQLEKNPEKKPQKTEDFADESDSELDRRALKQRTSEPVQKLMQPEQMDEDMYSDEDSQADDDNLYDEFPSSDSEDLDDWFTLDIRVERVSDYLPLLGVKAHEVLLEEKKRVSSRLEELHRKLTALTEHKRRRAARLRAAAAALADVDDLIKAA